ncbi:ABC-type antimicrobial peptide transport system permease subunit [Arthrobacter pigmenti]|uniref:ABC-type antimicrobial peptide transport system permease subunit n=1 Tax=Arthrobacter pigmenti TaxID=271432 RepID=A0A846RL72_9MICC|nr:hypothetical protein [Arthrobacter pigmenti]NJC21024.1 ABC-type antimicrobial peptide transport system permease subunit [Arthrobacter pigmenti]
MKRNLVAIAAGLLAGLLLAPAGSRGGCASGGECYSTPFSVVGLPTNWIIAVAAVLIVGILAWALYPAWRDRHMGMK